MDKRYEGLDGLRAVAAVAVLFHHIGVVTDEEVMTGGYLAVDFFFLMSGFVLAAAYERSFADGLHPLRYVGLRLRRLYPMIALGAVLGVAAAIAGGWQGEVWLAAAAQLALVPFVTASETAFPLNNPQWSLLFELLVNAFHVLIWPWLTLRRLIALVAALGAALLGVLAVHHNLGVGWGRDNALMGAPRVGFPFFLGVLLFRIRDRLPAIRAPYALILMALAASLSIPHIEVTASDTVRDALLVFVVFPLILIAAIKTKLSAGWRRIALVGGAMSYPLYAIHYPLLDLAALVPVAAEWSLIWNWAVVPIAIVGFAMAVERWCERPVLKRLSRRRVGAADPKTSPSPSRTTQ
jgi:peptidoglycan/LPS O-acetylase OafA/YrhL